MNKDKLTVDRKALLINLDQYVFGTFAEIGAGQEVARQFFQVGGAAGTVAKTMSAYDMTFSDSIYGKAGRYVSKERLISMLDHEYNLLIERLSEKRGKETTFFVFADTVAARGYKSAGESHGWLGIRFQKEPGVPPSDIIIHVRMTDKENILQQQALGFVGVNLVHGAFYYRDNPELFVTGLLDNLSTDRIEIDMIEFSGYGMEKVDNRLMSLKLLQHNLTNAIIFAPGRKVLQPSEVLYKRPILIERGSFRPVTHVNIDMIEGAKKQMLKESVMSDKDPLVIYEITLNNLSSAGKIDDADFIARADTLSALGNTVMISNYSEHYRLTGYFRRYTKEMIGMVMGINTLIQIFNEDFYQNLEGGILEALGRLFGHNVKLYVYPMTSDAYKRYIDTQNIALVDAQKADLPDLVSANEVHVMPHLKHLYVHLLSCGAIEGVTSYDQKCLSIFSRDVFSKIGSGDPSWKECVPAAAVKVITEQKMFGHK